MDFGLAQLAERSRLTKLDTTLGTVAYMSPEQTEGAKLDHRSDIWSLGVVLYEMVSGQQPFQGHYNQAVTYSIVHEEPEPLTGLRTAVPMELELLIGKCLAKDAGHRYQHADELVVDLETLGEKLKSGKSKVMRTAAMAEAQAGEAARTDAAAASLSAQLQSGRSAVAKTSVGTRSDKLPAKFDWPARLPWVCVALLLVVLAVVWFDRPAGSRPAPVLRKYALNVERARYASISPNGQYIAFVVGESSGTSALWLYDLAQGESRQLTVGGGADRPFWSPDSQHVAIRAGTDLRRISVQGGTAVRICSLRGPFGGGTWSLDGKTIVFASGSLYEVAALGGEPQDLLTRIGYEGTESDGPLPRLVSLRFLPVDDGSRVLAYTVGRGSGRFEQDQLVVENLDDGTRHFLTRGLNLGYSTTGHILYWHSQTRQLMALPFSLGKLEPAGEPFALAGYESSALSASTDATLVLSQGSSVTSTNFVWRDRRGGEVALAARVDTDVRFPDLSPDGKLAVTGQGVIRIQDLERGVSTQVTYESNYLFPVFAPWGVLYGGGGDIVFRPADMSGGQTTLVPSCGVCIPCDVDFSGRHIVYGVRKQGAGNFDAWRMERDAEGNFSEPVPFLETPFATVDAQISPDGEYIAYATRPKPTDAWQVVIRPFPGAGPQVQVTQNGGAQPRWNPAGDEIFYANDGELFAVEVDTEPQLRAGKTTRLFSHPAFEGTIARQKYCVAEDGRSFLLLEPDEDDEQSSSSILVVENWFEEFRDLQGGRQQ